MRTYKIKAVIPASVIQTITIEAENSIEAMRKFNLRDFKSVKEVVTLLCHKDAVYNVDSLYED